MSSKFHPNFSGLNVRRNGPQPSIFVRSFSPITNSVNMITKTEPMNASVQFCPNPTCSASGLTKRGNITIHDRQRQRYRCKMCRQSFTARTGTMLEGLRKPGELVVIVAGLLSYGCPLQAIVHVCGLDERRGRAWRAPHAQ